jgi:hypothetical protein
MQANNTEGSNTQGGVSSSLSPTGKMNLNDQNNDFIYIQNNESNYDSIYKMTESNIKNISNIATIIVTQSNDNKLCSNILSFNRNNSQLSDKRIENNDISNTSSHNNNTQPNNLENANTNNTFIMKKVIKNLNTPLNGLTSLFNNTSPKISYSNKLKSIVDNLGVTVGISYINKNLGISSLNSNSKSSLKPHAFLEYQNKEAEVNNKNSSNLQSAVMFNGTDEYFNFNQNNVNANVNMTPTNVINANTITNASTNSLVNSNINSTNLNAFHPNPNFTTSSKNTNNINNNLQTENSLSTSKNCIEVGSSTNRYSNKNNYENNNNLLNDMKFNGPKKDEFNLKTSKGREKSKERGNINSTHSFNNTSNKMYNVQFSGNAINHNNYLVSKSEKADKINEKTSDKTAEKSIEKDDQIKKIGNSGSVNVNNNNNKSSENNMQNKIDKYYSKLVKLQNTSPKNSTEIKIRENFINSNTNNTYSLSYKEKIINKSHKFNLANMSNTFQKLKK